MIEDKIEVNLHSDTDAIRLQKQSEWCNLRVFNHAICNLQDAITVTQGSKWDWQNLKT